MRLTLFLFILLPSYLVGQTLSIHISDSKTNEALPFANLYLIKSGIGASTNMEGFATLETSKILDKDSMIVSYIGYESQTVFLAKTRSLSTLEIKLVAISNTLSEVVVTYKVPPKPKKILKQALKNTAQNYSNKDIIYNSLYRETIQENGEYIQLNEAFLKTYYTSYPQKKLDRKIWESYSYDQSYAFELDGEFHFRPLLKDFNTPNDQQTVIASRHSDKLSKYGIETTLNGDPLLLFAFDKIKYQYDFLNPAIWNKYTYKLEGTEFIHEEECYIISFRPKSSKGKFRIDQSKKNKSAIYIGRMYIGKKTNALLRFKYKLAVDRNFGFFAGRVPMDYQVEMNYKKGKNFYSINNIKFTQTKIVGRKANKEAIIQTANKEIYVRSIDSNNVTSFADSTIFKSTSASSLRYYKNNYNPDYWNTVDLTDSLQLSDKLISDLEIKTPLLEQFESYKFENKKDIPVPAIYKEYFSFDYHKQKVVDSLHWMALPQGEDKFRTYLSKENKYANNELIEDKKYQKLLFDKLNTFYPVDTSEIINRKIGTYFFDEDSLDNVVYYYQKDSINLLEVFNLSEFKDKHQNIYINNLIPNESLNKILVQYEKVGTLGDFVSILPFGAHTILDTVSDVYTSEWLNESTFLYSKTDKVGRAGALVLRNIETKLETIVYTEADPRFDVEVIKENNQLFATIQSRTENEIYWINLESTEPVLELVKERRVGMSHSVETSDGLYILVNDEQAGSSIEYASFDTPSKSKVLSNAEKDDHIRDIIPLKNKIVALVYENSIPKIKYFNKGDTKWNELKLKLGMGDFWFYNSQKEPNAFSFSFSSPSNPATSYRYDFDEEKLIELSKQKLKNPYAYKSVEQKRLWAVGHDDTKIPITIIKKGGSKVRHNGLILKVYGAYGALTIPSFNARDAILLNEGYTIAYAHVRGESILGPKWYKAGRALQKKNSISDYLACAEFLIKEGHTNAQSLIGYGNSAGGLVVAQAINMRPDLFKTVILDHAYLDVVNTMMNDTLHMTIDDYKEFGNPKEKPVYDYILDYSPYHNIKPQHYPNVLLLGSYQDFQTPMWQIAKYTAKLRANNLSDSSIILLTDMNSGHIGNTSGKEWIKVFAKTYSFVHLKSDLKVQTGRK